MASSSYLGIEIGGTKLQLVIGTASGETRDRRRFAIEPSLGAAGILKQIASALPGLLSDHTPQAIGVGFGGPVHAHTGEIVTSNHVPGWTQFPLGRWLRERCGDLPVQIENDANVAGLGEAHVGAGRDLPSIFYVTLGSGVGGGLIQGGRIFHGSGPTETEIGHLLLDRSGTTVESRCSGWAVDRRIHEYTTGVPDGELARRVTADPHAPARHLAPALAAGDPLARQLIDEVGADLGWGLSHVVQLMSPARIVIGGGLSLVGPPLIASIQRGLAPHVMTPLQPPPAVTTAELGEDVVPIGAILLASQAASPSRSHANLD